MNNRLFRYLKNKQNTRRIKPLTIAEAHEIANEIERLNNEIKILKQNNINEVLKNDLSICAKQYKKSEEKLEKANKKIDRLNNIINELEKYIASEYYCFDNESLEFEIAKNILDKLKELKENK